MPAILRKTDEPVWLASEPLSPAAISWILAPYPTDEPGAYQVSRMVNDFSNDSPDVIVLVKEMNSPIGGAP
jgi:putative SOS response-associated peptidase YedK